MTTELGSSSDQVVALESAYQFIDNLGSGAFGQVFKVKIKNTSAIRAIKLIQRPEDPKKNKSVRGYVEAEAKTLQKLSSVRGAEKYVVKFYRAFFGELRNKQYYVIEMEYLDGVDLNEYAKNYQSEHPSLPYVFNLSNVCDTTRHLLQAVQYIHQLGIAHRDIKPTNIMITHGDSNNPSRLLLVDFGLACIIKECRGVAGTAGFIDPFVEECFHDSKCVIDWVKADIYSLGKTIQWIIMKANGSTQPINRMLWDMSIYKPKKRITLVKALDYLKLPGACIYPTERAPNLSPGQLSFLRGTDKISPSILPTMLPTKSMADVEHMENGNSASFERT